MAEPVKLSVFMLTYNHENTLSRALDSVFSQQHDFSFQIVIGDDKSTDHTRNVITDYQQKYPGKIKAIFNPKNIGMSKNALNVLQECDGAYIAFLDGDDYWTDPLKLRKQISFLDTHDDFVLSCHRYEKYVVEEKRFDNDHAWPELFEASQDGFELNPGQFFTHWFTQPLTVVIRRSAVEIDKLQKYRHFKDVHLFFNILNNGKGFVHGFFGAVYNIHSKGFWNGLSEIKKLKSDLRVLDELLRTHPVHRTLQSAYTKTLRQLHELLIAGNYHKLSPAAIWVLYKKSVFWLRSAGYDVISYRRRKQDLAGAGNV